MNNISFMSANFVARELGYNMPEGWGQGDAATQAWFAPLETFGERFDEMIREIKELGFTAIDLWTAHLHFSWTTPAHLRIAKDCLVSHGMEVASYAGGFGNNIAEFEAACLVCRELSIPVMGGGLPVLQTHRDAVIKLLHRHGLVFAIENHPEKSAAEVLEKLGQGDEDVLGVAVDTGWFATQEADVLAELRQLGNRIRHVHLKDVLPRGKEKTGYMFKDMGHETCELGTGIVPVEKCLQYLVASGYKGGIAVEHEPEDVDPRGDCGKSLKKVQEWLKESVLAITPDDPVGVAIVGCGNVATRYAQQINSYPHVRLLGAQDIDESRAAELTRQHGGKVYASLEDLLADPQVEVVVNLTIHHVHEEIITKCLNAGKHVHTEKPLALNSRAAWDLVGLAKEKGLRLSSAPTTWLGEIQLTAARKVREGAIGTPRVAYAEVNWGRIESWHPNPAPFYDVGVVFDVAVYPLTLLTAWFGPVKKVLAGGGILYPDRQTKEGKPFKVGSPDWTAAILEFQSGFQTRLTASFYAVGPFAPRGLTVFGDDGSIELTRWDVFNANAFISNGETGGESWQLVPDQHPAKGIEFARGLSDMAQAIREDRPHRTSGEHAAHVVEIAEAILTSIREGKTIELPERSLEISFPD